MKLSKREKRNLLRIILSGIIFTVAILISLANISEFISITLFSLAYIITAYDVLWAAAKNIARGQVFDENFLMAVASIGAFCLGEYSEGTAVILFYQVGEFFQSYAVSKSRRSISELMDIRPDYANIKRDGLLVQVDPEELAVGDIIFVKPGEKIPLDATIIEGESSIDSSALTGESAPRDVAPGDEAISGCVNISGLLTLRVTKEFGESTVFKILELVENATDKKSKNENFITKFARYYTPAVVIAALLLALVPPLLTGQDFSLWIKQALTFLVISCPCALVISVPLSFFGGIGGASKVGVLIKGSNYLETLARAEIAVFDKTGTLTKGNFSLSEIHPIGISAEALLNIAAHAESYSTHPIAQSIQKAYGKTIDSAKITEIEEIAGHGVRARIENNNILAGNAKFMRREGIDFEAASGHGSFVYIAVNETFAGYLRIEDEIKPDSKTALAELKKLGIKKTVMLTGDMEAEGRRVADLIGIDEAYTNLLPYQKVEKTEALLGQKSPSGKLIFVGDGINDAPVLARADIGIAMGGLGSDAAIEAADIVIMTDEPSKLAAAIKISKKTLNIVRQNIVFALFVKFLIMLLGIFGLATMWGAVFADVGVSLLAIINAMRAAKLHRI